MRTLERRLDLKLLNRTTRSVAPRQAGEQLYRTVEPRLAEIDAELAVLGEMRHKPIGTITASEHAVRTLIWPRLLPGLLSIPISVHRHRASRFDIGIRLGDDVAKDMIAVRIAPDRRLVVAGSPSCFSRHPHPQSPHDLSAHDRISLRLPTHGGLLLWGIRTRAPHRERSREGEDIATGQILDFSRLSTLRPNRWRAEEEVAPKK